MPAKKSNTVREWFNTIFYGGLIAIIFRSFLLEPFNIPSGSMIPTLHVGDHIFVEKWEYGYSRYSFPFGSWRLWNGRFWASEPEMGDVIVFRNPVNESMDYVKRLIGRPGDTVQMKNGRLYINGEIVKRENPRPYIWAVLPKAPKRGHFKRDKFEIDGNKIFIDDKPAEFNYTIQYNAQCTNTSKKFINLSKFHDGFPESDATWFPAEHPCGIFVLTEYTETLPNGVTHSIIETSDDMPYPVDDTSEFTVPENHYFFMGDNRDNSGDSRFGHGLESGIGFVPRDNVLGRVWFIWYSHNYFAPMPAVWSWGKKMRWDRFGMGIN